MCLWSNQNYLMTILLTESYNWNILFENRLVIMVKFMCWLKTNSTQFTDLHFPPPPICSTPQDFNIVYWKLQNIRILQCCEKVLFRTYFNIHSSLNHLNWLPHFVFLLNTMLIKNKQNNRRGELYFLKKSFQCLFILHYFRQGLIVSTMLSAWLAAAQTTDWIISTEAVSSK